jgi:hypothetical protein
MILLWLSRILPVPGVVNTMSELLITLNVPWSDRSMLKLAEKLAPMRLSQDGPVHETVPHNIMLSEQ